MKRIECRISTVEPVSEDILFIDIQSDQKFGIEDYIEIKQAALKIGEGESFYNIINLGEFTIPDREARLASCSLEGSYYKKADAFVIQSLPQKLVVKLFLKTHKPVVPTRVFNTREEAEKWIKSIRSTRISLNRNLIL
ncbi:MAG: hypothetical protein R2780_09315 [Crocinitomicaceae bacterium]